MLYLIGGLVLAFLVSSGIGGCEHKAKIAAQKETAVVQGRFDSFVAEAKRIGDEQETKTAAQEAKQKEVLNDTRKRYLAELATRDAAIRRLRERPPERPDSSAVPISTGCAPGANDSSREWIPLEEYRQLEARAYDDALRLTRLQQWVRDTSHPIE